MSNYKELVVYLLVLTTVVSLITINFELRIRKLEQQSATGFTVVCAKYKYRETTRNYEGYDCSIFGGKDVK